MEKLEAIALKFGATFGDKPSVSALIKAIAQGKLCVHWADAPPPSNGPRKVAIVAALTDIHEARDKLAKLLLG